MTPQQRAAEVSTAVPNYKIRCIGCGATPTVDMMDSKGVHHLSLCGPCTFGEARMLDPEEWNK